MSSGQRSTVFSPLVQKLAIAFGLTIAGISVAHLAWLIAPSFWPLVALCIVGVPAVVGAVLGKFLPRRTVRKDDHSERADAT